MKLYALLSMLSYIFLLGGCNESLQESIYGTWINIDYLECLEQKLPCECEKETDKYFTLSLTEDSKSGEYLIAVFKHDFMEPYYYYSQNTEKNIYVVLEAQGSDSMWAKIELRNDTLYFIEDEVLSSFIQVKGDGESGYLTLSEANAYFLNKSFISRGYTGLQDIAGHESLNCDCNKWIDRKNILYVKGKSDSWILELKGDSLYIEKIINPDRDPIDPVQSETIKSLYW